jgi:basic amino acid/polyamine antiporter, APA family
MRLTARLTLFDAVLLIIGNMVGAGIFTTSGFLAGELHHPAMFVGIWIVGGGLTLCGALTYAELAGMFPHAGGDYHFLKAAYGRWAGFLLGWVNFWVIGPGSTAALSIAFASYIKAFLPVEGLFQAKLCAIGCIMLFSFINYRGIRPGGTTQDIVTLGTILLLAAMIIGGFLSGNGRWTHFIAAHFETVSWSGLFSSAMIAVIFTYSGWFASAQIGSEILKPERNLPLSLALGTCVVTVLYTAMNVLYLYALPVGALKNVENVAQLAITHLLTPYLAVIVTLTIVLAIASSINANIMTGARICYAMAKDGIFLSCIERLHPLYNTPHVAIVCQSAIACIFVILGTFNQILGCVVVVMLLSSIFGGLAVFVLRRSRPLAHRPYRTFGYPLTPLLFIGSYALIAGQVAYAKPFLSLLGIAIVLSGLPFYFWQEKQQLVRQGS